MASKPDTKNTTAKSTSNAPRVEPKIGTGTVPGLQLPPRPTRGAGASKYPFDSLGVGEFFSVKNKTRRQMASPVMNANKKNRKELTDPNGKVTKIQEREFYASDVDAATADKLKGTEHEGAQTLIVRAK